MHLNHKSLFLLIGLSLAALSALLRFWALDQTPFANGWDSYFYLGAIEIAGRNRKRIRPRHH